MKIQRSQRLLASALLAALTGGAYAQSDQNLSLEEVLVTAQKREQSIQDIPIAVTAIDAAAIERKRITRITDISLYAPNTEIVESPTNTTGATISIRGANQINPAITWENSVGVYLDGVFIGKNLGGVFDVADLERVEVLRGPQGTLYGKNTVGGAVNLVTRKPSGEFGGRVTGEVGNEGFWSGRVSVDTAEVAGFKGSFTYYTEERDGFADNNPDPFGNPLANPPSNSEFQDSDEDSTRIALLWDATDNFSAQYSYDYNDQEILPRFGQLTQTGPNSVLYAGGVQEPYLTDDDDRAGNGSNDWAIKEDAQVHGHAVHLDWRLDDITLRSITSRRKMEFDEVIDIDGTAIDIFHSGREIDYDSWSQEFQLLGSWENLDYVLGFYYFDEDADVYNPIQFFGFTQQVPLLNNSYGLENESIAAFGQADWRPGMFDDRLTVTLGLRWTEEDKDQYIDHPEAFFAEKADDTFDNTSPTVALAWAFTDDINGYVRYAKGWKSGGFNGEASTPEEFLAGYDDEEVDAYEVGLKTLLWDGRLQLNMAGFYNEFDDFQASVFEGAQAASLVFNVPDFETKGVELEAVALITEDLRVSVNYGYLDAEYKEFPDGLLEFFDEDEAGTPYAPDHNLTVGVDWTVLRADHGTWDLYVDYSYLDDYVPYFDPDQNASSQIDDRSLVNARLALSDLQFGGGSLIVALWGQNLTDEDYRINTIPFGGVDQRIDPDGGSGVGWTTSYFGAPRTYGVELSYLF